MKIKTHCFFAALSMLLLASSVVRAEPQKSPTVPTTSQLKESAGKGDAKAQYDLGVRYAKGDGVPKNLTQTLALFRKSAAQGFAPAQYELGVGYQAGQNIEKECF